MRKKQLWDATDSVCGDWWQINRYAQSRHCQLSVMAAFMECAQQHTYTHIHIGLQWTHVGLSVLSDTCRSNLFVVFFSRRKIFVFVFFIRFSSDTYSIILSQKTFAYYYRPFIRIQMLLASFAHTHIFLFLKQKFIPF